jgi:sigma-54 specific flagellar transcriptional regulator A
VLSKDVSRFLDLPSPAMRVVADMVEKIAPLGSTVFIQGPSGSGKEIVARSIHNQSNRASGPFVPVNCGAIPRDLLESELFGYEKGAFTGAMRERAGLMEMSAGGTLFLDEIGDMPLDMQVKLLRMIEERIFTRVGGTKPIAVDVRFVCATHRDLKVMIDEQKFREDLFYRINVFPIVLPPLRERLEDIPALINSIIKRFEAQGFPKAPDLTESAVNVLKSYDWPGNVRELRNILERAGALYADRRIDAELMSGMLFPGQPREVAEEQDAIWGALAEFAADDSTINMPDEEDEAPLQLSRVIDKDTFIRQMLASEGGFNLKDHIAALETDFIRVSLTDTDGSVSAAARLLGIQRTTLIEKMRKFSIGRPE